MQHVGSEALPKGTKTAKQTETHKKLHQVFFLLLLKKKNRLERNEKNNFRIFFTSLIWELGENGMSRKKQYPLYSLKTLNFHLKIRGNEIRFNELFTKNLRF